MAQRELILCGHGLQHAGRPVLVFGCCTGSRVDHLERTVAGQRGHALCRCGAISQCILDTGERREWHMQHKVTVVSKSYASAH